MQNGDRVRIRAPVSTTGIAAHAAGIASAPALVRNSAHSELQVGVKFGSEVNEKAATGPGQRRRALVVSTTTMSTSASTSASSSLGAAGQGGNASLPAPISLSPLTNISKLQTYLPTGTWITFTALQTLAFALSPSVEPLPGRNCNNSEFVALIVFTALSAVFAAVQPLVKSFVLDDKNCILYPPPVGVKISDTAHDDITGATFPYRDTSQRVLWPYPDPAFTAKKPNDRRWTRQGSYVLVMVFHKDVQFIVGDEGWLSKLVARFKPSKNIGSLLPRMSDDDPALMNPPVHTPATIAGELKHLPTLKPHWSGMMNGPKTQYVDFSRQAFLHSLVSVTSFLALSLLSTQVTGCFYPSIPDWTPIVVQVVVLAVVSALACFFVDDRAADPKPCLPDADDSTSPTTPDLEKGMRTADSEEEYRIPPILRHLVEETMWVRAASA
ncbi:hypothetical protein EXIGLDRAFT_719805 [Exidia glandulosa HHB12029]|uniref:Uncharacterized protein n=1 Tax=Exidia glandulosa HHB12029 TaxID=1314781 RepID=A0A165GT27_EXIGL|nr:hypothetical protein EXIGLDRAFT_719805 [Exidia glandulosa HHB12029]